MVQDTHSDGTEPNAGTEDSNSHGQPLTCPNCGETITLHYHPQANFPANYAGFVAHCNCTMGAQLNGEAVEDLAPKWFAETVLETEKDGKDWLEYYVHDNYGTSRWTGDDDE